MGAEQPGRMAEEPLESGAQETLESLRAERDELAERLQRAAADYQNLRRRGLAEAEERLRRAMEPLLRKMLIVLDYLDLALTSPATTPEARNLALGVRLTRDQFVQALEQEDVRPIPASERFDPSLHDATGTVPREDLTPGTIVEVVRPGYTWRGEVLRHAQVLVCVDPLEAKAQATDEPSAAD
jgi:molecular chaperone GrpE